MAEPHATGIGCLALSSFIFVIIVIMIPVTIIIFQIMMIIDCSKYQKENKELWIIILIIGSIVGATIYYFMFKKNRITPPKIKKRILKTTP